ncbi:MAG: hypothetical protein V4494_03330 [Chlamydiota bacterium]
MSKMRALILSICATTTCFSAEINNQTPNPEELRVVPMRRSPEADEVEMTIVYPKENEVKTSQPLNLQMRLEGFPLGIDSELPREHEIFNDPQGQCVRVAIDNRPHFSENEAFIDALDDYEEYYEEDMEFKVPFNLEPGMHIMRTFLVRSFGECLKCERCFAVRTFYVQSKTPTLDIDLTQPYLTYNEPQGKYHFNPSMPLLLDFYLTNCQLSKDGYKVRLTVDGKDKRVLYSWVPYYLYGLSKGNHTIKLELIDPENHTVPGLFNTIERTVILE